MKTLPGLLLFATGIAVTGLATWFLLKQNVALGRWLLAALLVAHGWVHVMFVFPRPTPSAGGSDWPFDLTRSWLVTGTGVDVAVLRTIGIALMAIVVVGFVIAALSIVGLLLPAGWWGGLLVVSAAASFLMLGLFFSPQLALGLAIDLALLWLVFGSGWSPISAIAHAAGLGSA